MKLDHSVFVANIVADPSDVSGARAAVAAGFSKSYGKVLLDKPEIQDAIEARKLRIMAPLEITARDVVEFWLDVARADVTNIAHVRRTCCRYCWGIDHAYQWGEREYAQAVFKARHGGVKERGPDPTCEGGLDWQHNQRPNPECPECAGEGHAEFFMADMRDLSPRDKRLIASVSQTKEGVKYTYHSQPDAWMNIAKALGMKIGDKVELSGPNGGPIQTTNANVHVNLADLTPQDASKLYQALVSGKP